MNRRVMLLVLVAAGTGAGLVRVASRAPVTAAEAPAPRATGTRPADLPIAGPGRIEAATEEVDVAPERSGTLAQVLVEEGDTVHAGQVIARLVHRDDEARVEAARARLAVAEADRVRLVNGARPEERRESTAVAAQANAALAHARIEVERTRALFAEGVIARETLDRAERDWRVATARRTETNERAAVVDAAARADELARADAEVQLARATLAEAMALLEKAVVRAPIDGVVLRKHHHAGEAVSLDAPQPAVVTMADTRELRARVEVDERDVAGLSTGRAAWVTADAFGTRRFEGRVIRVGRMLGRKQVRTGQPAEKVDTKVLEVLVELAPGTDLPIGLRVDGYIERRQGDGVDGADGK
ncbi:MAG: HlyD family secretion protein [Alphaproteobacteria bacterium]